MKNTVELTQDLQVIASENTNNSEIEVKSIEEENKISEEVTAESSEKEEKEVKTLDTNKPFKWTNEATKAAACMLKDIIDDYEKSSNSASLDEEIADPWGYAKLDKQMNLLKESKELDLFPEILCRYKLVSLLDKYLRRHHLSPPKYPHALSSFSKHRLKFLMNWTSKAGQNSYC